LTSIGRDCTVAGFAAWSEAGSERALDALAAGTSRAVLIDCTAGPVSLNVSVGSWLRIGAFELVTRFLKGAGALIVLLAGSVRIDCAESEGTKVECDGC
jgi:hypothetical protein